MWRNVKDLYGGSESTAGKYEQVESFGSKVDRDPGLEDDGAARCKKLAVLQKAGTDYGGRMGLGTCSLHPSHLIQSHLGDLSCV